MSKPYLEGSAGRWLIGNWSGYWAYPAIVEVGEGYKQSESIQLAEGRQIKVQTAALGLIDQMRRVQRMMLSECPRH